MSQKNSQASNSKSAASQTAAERSLNNQNARGVQFMREGKLDEAISILRSLVMPPGCTWTRPEAPDVFKRNFATALLLAGHPSGCLELLAGMRDDQHPRVQQMRAAIKRWEKSLSFFQWLNWRTGWIEPAGRPVLLDFIPGELESDEARLETIQVGSTGSHLSTAL